MNISIRHIAACYAQDRCSLLNHYLTALGIATCLAIFALLAGASAASAQESQLAQAGGDAARPTIVLPLVDPARGRRLFVTKGCVICHSVQGIGGKAAPALDAPKIATTIDILEFVARMWRGAPAMLDLQAVELGYQIELDGAEIADLAAFAADADTQKGFSEAEVPEPMRDWMLNLPYWEEDDWPEDLPDDYPEFENETEL